MFRLSFVVLLGLVGCVRSQSVECGGLVCSKNAVCAPSGDRCVLQSQIDACTGADDFSACAYGDVRDGICEAQICVVAGCGNGIVEPKSNEICDDGNRMSGDGCSADCRSLEVCGDGVVDVANNEYCDCGTNPAQLPLGCTMENSAAPGASCRADCTRGGCGDGVIDPGELCDDGNNTAGDGCRADCQGRWTQMATNTFDDFKAVSVIDAQHAYAATANGVFAWDGTSWSELAGAPPFNLSAIAAVAPNDIYIASDNTLGSVYHFNGTIWSERTPGPAANWRALYARSANDVWLVGGTYPSVSPLVYHWTGSWTPLTTSGLTQSNEVDDVWVSSSNEVYVIDDQSGVYHFNGSSWNLDTASQAGMALDGSSAADLVLLNNTSIYQHSGAAWTLVPNSTNLVGHGLSVFQDQAVAVGSDGRILTRAAGSWRVSISPTPRNLNAVKTYAPGRAFIVGSFGTILY